MRQAHIILGALMRVLVRVAGVLAVASARDCREARLRNRSRSSCQGTLSLAHRDGVFAGWPPALRGLPGQRRSAGRRSRLRGKVVEAAFPSVIVPRGIALSPDGSTSLCHQLLVRHGLSDRHDDAREVVQTLPPDLNQRAWSPTRPATTLYVANRLSSDISVIDLSDRTGNQASAGRTRRQLSCTFSGWQMRSTARTSIRMPGAFRTQPNSEITVIDTDAPNRGRPQAAPQRGRSVSRGDLGRWQARCRRATPAQESDSSGARRTRMGLRRFAHVVWTTMLAATVQIPIDELDRYYALPWGVAITPDKSKIFVTTAGSESVTVIDVPRLLKTVRTRTPSPSSTISPRRQNYVIARIPVGHNPRGVAALAGWQASLRRQSPRRQHFA